ncbi:MAG: glycosyltransferase family 4 protein [Candidatus Eiseniibacteriota bacterium]
MSAHLLAVNFRDPHHPDAGGAELHLEEILLEGVRRGWRVTWLAAGFPGGGADTDHRGIRVVRRGSWWNFNLVVPGVIRREFSDPPPDWLIEDINKVPCFTPLWSRAPVAAIVPHLFGATALRETSLPVALYVMALEALIPAVYRRSRFLAISESTRDDLVRRGIGRDRVSVVHCGIDHQLYRTDPRTSKSERPTIVFVGRLRRYKGLDWVIRTMPKLLARIPSARLVVIGDGPHAGELKLAAARLGVAPAVAFLGFLPAEEKAKWIRQAWAAIQPSPKEGWGLTVIEASACGTAVVAADSPGLRDSVRDGETGVLVRYGDDDALAAALAHVLADPQRREALAAAGLRWAATFTWPDCARRSIDALIPAGAPAGALA